MTTFAHIPIRIPTHFVYSLQFYPSCIAPANYDQWSDADKRVYQDEQLRIYRQQAKKVFKWSDGLTKMHEKWDTPVGATVGEFSIMHEYLANKQRQLKAKSNSQSNGGTHS